MGRRKLVVRKLVGSLILGALCLLASLPHQHPAGSAAAHPTAAAVVASAPASTSERPPCLHCILQRLLSHVDVQRVDGVEALAAWWSPAVLAAAPLPRTIPAKGDPRSPPLA